MKGAWWTKSFFGKWGGFYQNGSPGVRARSRITAEDRALRCVGFGRDDRAGPQEYSKYFEDSATEERLKMARLGDARTVVLLERAQSV
jgi:hypothetical protein